MKIACLTLAFFCLDAASAAGEPMLFVHTGRSAQGSLTTDSVVPVNSKSLEVSLQYFATLASSIDLGLGGSGNLSLVEYSVDGDVRKGILRTAGVGPGIRTHLSSSFDGMFAMELCPAAFLSVGSRSSTTINGQNVERASVTEYRGSGGLIQRLAVARRVVGWPVPAGQMAHLGGALNYSILDFHRKSDTVAVSDPDLAGASGTKSETVRHRMKTLSVSLFLGVSI